MTFQESELRKPLQIKDIDFRIQSINNGKYANILAYKDARCDMNRLDEVFGVFGWKREHLRDNKNCIVSVWCEDKQQWVSKEDTGTESNTEQEKGLASDSFKRACFNLGIGRELYDYPVISVKLNNDEIQETGKARPKYKASFGLNLREWVWQSKFNEDNELIHLSVKDAKGNVRFSYEKVVKPQLKIGTDTFTKAREAYLSKKVTLQQIKAKYDVSKSVESMLTASKK